LRVQLDEVDSKEVADTIVLNKGYRNITSVFEDDDRRDRDNDTLTVTKSLEGSYPNFFLEGNAADLERFAERLLAIRTSEDYEAFVTSYGIRWTNPAFWSSADWYHAKYAQDEPIRAGLFDLNRYHHRQSFAASVPNREKQRLIWRPCRPWWLGRANPVRAIEPLSRIRLPGQGFLRERDYLPSRQAPRHRQLL
jgi:hypothetical protein